MNIDIKRVIKKWSGALLAVVAGSMLFAACSESDDTGSEFDDWQNKNTTYWNALYAKAQDSVKAGNTNWKIIKNWSLEDSLQSPNTDYIIVHVKEKGTGTASPLYTDTVRTHYTGRLILSAWLLMVFPRLCRTCMSVTAGRSTSLIPLVTASRHRARSLPIPR